MFIIKIDSVLHNWRLCMKNTKFFLLSFLIFHVGLVLPMEDPYAGLHDDNAQITAYQSADDASVSSQNQEAEVTKKKKRKKKKKKKAHSSEQTIQNLDLRTELGCKDKVDREYLKQLQMFANLLFFQADYLDKFDCYHSVSKKLHNIKSDIGNIAIVIADDVNKDRTNDPVVIENAKRYGGSVLQVYTPEGKSVLLKTIPSLNQNKFKALSRISEDLLKNESSLSEEVRKVALAGRAKCLSNECQNILLTIHSKSADFSLITKKILEKDIFWTKQNWFQNYKESKEINKKLPDIIMQKSTYLFRALEIIVDYCEAIAGELVLIPDLEYKDTPGDEFFYKHTGDLTLQYAPCKNELEKLYTRVHQEITQIAKQQRRGPTSFLKNFTNQFEDLPKSLVFQQEDKSDFLPDYLKRPIIKKAIQLKAKKTKIEDKLDFLPKPLQQSVAQKAHDNVKEKVKKGGQKVQTDVIEKNAVISLNNNQLPSTNNAQVSNIIFANRVHKWLHDKEYRQMQPSKSCLYHSWASKALPFVKCGPKIKRRNNTFGTQDTCYQLSGDLIFDNPEENPFKQGQVMQTVVFHCTENVRGCIYHIGLKAYKNDGNDNLFDEYIKKGYWNIDWSQLGDQEATVGTTSADDGSYIEKETPLTAWIKDPKNRVTIVLHKGGYRDCQE